MNRSGCFDGWLVHSARMCPREDALDKVHIGEYDRTFVCGGNATLLPISLAEKVMRSVVSVHPSVFSLSCLNQLTF